MASIGAVVIGGYINGLGLVRSLASRGVPVAVIETQPYDICGSSRFVAGKDRVRDLDIQPDALVEIFRRRGHDWPGWAILPSTDDALAAVARHHDALAAHHPIIAPNPDAVRVLIDKRVMRKAAASLGIRLPVCHGPVSPTPPRLDDAQFPVVVKPSAGSRFAARFGRKLFVARDASELSTCADRVASAGIPCEAYELIPGDDDQIFAYTVYLDRRGEPRGGLTIRKIRQSPSGFGVARMAELVPDVPELRDATIALARHLGLVGVAECEWKRDARDGGFRFIEINGRPVIFNALLRRGGLDLAAMAYGEVVEGRLADAQPTGWPGVWVNLHADVLHALLGQDEPRPSWRSFSAPYRRPLLEAVWSAQDPGPFLTQWGRSARELLLSQGAAARQQG